MKNESNSSATERRMNVGRPFKAGCTAGWEDDPHSIAEQRTITDGRIVPVGNGFISWQDRIAEVQNKAHTLKHLQTETAAELDALLPAVLDKAFRGEL